MMKKAILSGALALALGMSGSVFAQDTMAPDTAAPAAQHKMHKKHHDMFAKLNLTKEQKVQVRDIMKKQHEETQKQIRDILTPEQQKTFDEMATKHKAKRQSHKKMMKSDSSTMNSETPSK